MAISFSMINIFIEPCTRMQEFLQDRYVRDVVIFQIHS